MLKELIQELNQIVTDVETLTRENRKVKAEKETFNSQLAEVNRTLNMTLDDKAALEAEVASFNVTIENLRTEN